MTLNKKYTLASALALTVIMAGAITPVFNSVSNTPSVVYAENVLNQEQPKNDSSDTVKDNNAPVFNKGQRVAGKIKEKVVYSEESSPYSQAVVNGGSDLKLLDVNNPINNAAVVMQTRKGGTVLSGSGMFVSPNVYVTVAHNFLNDQGETGNITSMDYWVGSNTERVIRPTSGISKPISLNKVHFFNKEAYGNPPAGTKKAYYDLAVVVTDEPLMLTQPGYDFNDLVKTPQTMSEGTPVKVVGYPGKLDGITAPVKKGLLYEQSSTNVVRDALMPHSNFYLIPNTTVAGMSGAGVLSSNNQVMGVHQFGYSDRVGLNGGLIFDQAQLDFINKIIQENKIQGFREKAGKKYYFQEDGHLAKNTEKNIDGRRWKFDQNGVATDIGVAKEEKPAEKPVENKPTEIKPATPTNPATPTKPVNNTPTDTKPAVVNPVKPSENTNPVNKPADVGTTKPSENKPTSPTTKTDGDKPVNITKPTTDNPSDKKDSPSTTDTGNGVSGTDTGAPSVTDKGNTPSDVKTDDKPNEIKTEKNDSDTKSGAKSDNGSEVKKPTVKEAIKTGAVSGTMILPLFGLAGGLGVAGAVYLSKKRKK